MVRNTAREIAIHLSYELSFTDKDVDTLLDLMKQAQVNIPLKAVVTPSNRSWVFGDLLAHLQEEHAAVTAAKENQTL